MKRIFVLILILTLYTQLYAQYRNPNGMPGPNYWQNKPQYSIEANLLTQESKIIAHEHIVYSNNSPCKLDSLVFNLYCNAIEDNSYSISGVCVNDSETKFIIDKTKMFVPLANPIMPSNSVDIDVYWTLKINKGKSTRTSHYETGYFVGYWYPQIAVFDDDGWDMVYHSGMEEFYFEDADYDITITADNGYNVWASVAKTDSQELANGVTKYHFVANNFYDFAFAAIKDIETTEIPVKSGSKEVNFIVLSNDKKICNHVKMSAEIVAGKMASEMAPAIEFPFSQLVVFDNGGYNGGMEFPGMINIGIQDNSNATSRFVIRHELAHEYAPFLAGFNQAKEGFMDEGFAMFLPFVAYNYDNMKEIPKCINKCFIMDESTGDIAENNSYPKLPLTFESFKFAQYSEYNSITYNKSFETLYMLREVLGNDKMTKLIHDFFLAWAGKHPKAEDFINAAKFAYGSDLDWFIKPWFYSPEHPDLAITQCRIIGNKIKVTIKNVTGVPISVKLLACNQIDADDCGYYTSNPQHKYFSPEIWKDGKQTIDIEFDKLQYPFIIELGHNNITDATYKNNFKEIKSVKDFGIYKD
ncbi:MAG: hypothetical protein MJ211_05275 [Bacteroidales bacterium]|nr:hypothetical protein [Bacteroidales bacterium]